MIKITLRDLILLNATLEKAKTDLEKTLEGIRGKDWREGIKKDARVSVKILFAELTVTEQRLNEIYLMPISFVHLLDSQTVDKMLIETGVKTERLI